MPTEQELDQTYSQMATDDLLQIMARKADYTEMAVDLVSRELQLRKVSPAKIEAAHAPEDPYKKLWMENCLYDLATWQKAAFYFLWLPVWFIYRASGYYSPTITFTRLIKRPSWLSYKSSGFILKGQQSSFYQITGFTCFIISMVMASKTTIGGAGIVFFVAWTLGFGLMFLFDLSYNRQRLAGKLQDAVDAGELPWGV